MKNQVSKQSIPSKVKCHHSTCLSEMWKTRGNQRRPTAFWSANFFDGPEMHAEDGVLWTKTREGFNHDPGPRQDHGRVLPRRNRLVVEPQVDPPRQNKDLQRHIVLVENYVGRKVEARKKDPLNLPGEAKGSLSSGTLLVEPEMSGTTVLCRPV